MQRSHWWPRTRDGRIALVGFVIVFAFAQPPLVYLLGNRLEPRVLGMPFLFVYLLVIYLVLIGILITAQRRGV